MFIVMILSFCGEDSEIFDVGSAGEEVEGLEFCDFVVFDEGGDVASLGNGVAGEINNSWGFDGTEGIDEFGGEAGARRIQYDSGGGGDEVGGFFGFG